MASTSNRAGADLWQRPDPAVCLGGCCLLSIMIAVAGTFAAAGLAVLIGLFMLAIAKPAWGILWRRLCAVNVFVLFMWLVVPFSTPGHTIWHWGLLSLSAQGVRLCALVTLKANAILFVFLALVAPMPLSTLARALSGLRCPQRLAWLLILMDRNIYLLGRDWRMLKEAAQLRCFVPAFNHATYYALAAMLAQLFLRAHERGQKLHEAMLLACCSGRLPWIARIEHPVADAAFVLFIAAMSAALLFNA